MLKRIKTTGQSFTRMRALQYDASRLVGIGIQVPAV
jgi:hypothetical protein